MSRYNPLCEVCRSRPKMDRCSCCEECWYSGAYSEAQRAKVEPLWRVRGTLRLEDGRPRFDRA